MRRILKYLISVLSSLFIGLSFGQVTFSTIPADNQLVGREFGTNLGRIIIEGEVNNTLVNYKIIQIDVFRDNVLYDREFYPLNFISNTSRFFFDIAIFAELANYSIKIYGRRGRKLTLEKEVNDIVAGDVFIIQGQSNAVAMMYDKTARSFESSFIRVFACGTSNGNNLLKNQNWYIAQGDGNSETDGNTGQWGLVLAKQIVDSLKIPVAIFNGANGGKEIEFFLAPNDYKNSQTSNYGRLYYRLKNTGLKDYVKAVLWSQGERNSGFNYTTSTADYKKLFLDLKSAWQVDYPNIQKFYIFQTKNGCGKPIEGLMRIKEAQRQLAFENADISIMSTASLEQYADNCHFVFQKGYKLFAERIFPLILRDLYNLQVSEDIDPPMIIDAYLSDSTMLIVETDAIELNIGTIAEDFELSNAENSSIVDIQTCQNKIVFNLSENPGTKARISYLAQYSCAGNFITNSKGLELICFNKFPVDGTKSLPSSIQVIACESFISPSGKVWTRTDFYSDTIPNASGCDSIIRIDLTINNSTTSYITEIACDSYTSPSGKVWTKTDLYTDTVPNTLGCDSVIRIDLKINNSTTSNISQIACNHYTSPSGKVWTRTGIYMDTISNSSGCDSIIIFDLTINNPTSSNLSITACNSYISPSGKRWTRTGIYQDTISNASGCDSIISIDLTINNPTSSNLSITACNSYISPSGKRWTRTGIYQDSISNTSGCDSVIRIDLTINNSITSSLTIVACDSFTSPSGKVWTRTGIYMDTISNNFGCDSIITYDFDNRLYQFSY